MLKDLSISGFEAFSFDEVRALYKKGIIKINNYFE